MTSEEPQRRLAVALVNGVATFLENETPAGHVNRYVRMFATTRAFDCGGPKATPTPGPKELLRIRSPAKSPSISTPFHRVVTPSLPSGDANQLFSSVSRWLG